MHVATRWEITLATDPNFLNIVLVVFSLAPNLTNLPFTDQVLTPSTNYLARATYFDNVGNSSTGPATAFTTLANGTIPYPGDPWSACVQPAGV